MRPTHTPSPRTPHSLRHTPTTADAWVRNRDQRFARFLTKRLAEAELPNATVSSRPDVSRRQTVEAGPADDPGRVRPGGGAVLHTACYWTP